MNGTANDYERTFRTEFEKCTAVKSNWLFPLVACWTINVGLLTVNGTANDFGGAFRTEFEQLTAAQS